MIEIDIPGFGILRLEYLVLDYNGTIAVDGQPVQGVKERLTALARHVEIHVLTADTFGGVEKKLSDIPCKIHVLPVEAQDKGKMEYIDRLGADRAVCIGNGRNDVMMLKKAALGAWWLSRMRARLPLLFCLQTLWQPTYCLRLSFSQTTCV